MWKNKSDGFVVLNRYSPIFQLSEIPMKKLRFVLMAAFALAPACVMSTPAHAQSAASSKHSYKPDEVLVKYKSGASEGQMFALNSKWGGKLLRKFHLIGWQQVRLPQGASIANVIAQYKSDPLVEFAEPNYKLHKVGTPNDPSFPNQWDMTKIQAPAAWNKTTGGGSVVVAVIDTGVDYTHPDLKANMWHNAGEIAGNGVDDDGNGYVDDVYGIDAANFDSDPIDDEDHGTHCAGSIGAVGNNGVGISGVNWNVKIMALKFMDSSGSGYTSDAIACLNYATMMKQRGVNVVATSNSWGGGGFSQAMKNAFDAASNAGILSAVAAGNEGANNETTPSYPASFTTGGIITVAASDSSDNKPSWSNYGATSVDLAAPGVSILSTIRGGYAYYSGTSMATPHVAGAIALLAAYSGSSSPAQLKAALLSSVDVLPQWQGKVLSNGRLNLAKAMDALAPTTPAIRRQADLTIRNASELASSASGDGLYNTDATNQNRTQTVSNATKATYYVEVQNDGDSPDVFKVNAPVTLSGWTVKYLVDSNNTDITTAIKTTSGWSTASLTAGASVRLRVEVTPGSTVAGSSSFAALMTAVSTNDTSKKDAVRATTSTPAPRVIGVDAAIRKFGDANYTGEGIVSTSTTNQTATQSTQRNNIAVYYIRLRNTGNAADTIRLYGAGSASTWHVRYFDDGTNADITSAVTGNTWRTPSLAAGATYEVRLEVTPLSGARLNTSRSTQVNATSSASSTRRDYIRALTTAVSNTLAARDFEPAPLTIKAVARGNRLVLNFGEAGIALDKAEASNPAYYTVIVAGRALNVISARYEESAALVVLETDGDTLQNASNVVGTFSDLPTLTGDTVSGTATVTK
jgi:subtilisin family serine protease